MVNFYTVVEMLNPNISNINEVSKKLYELNKKYSRFYDILFIMAIILTFIYSLSVFLINDNSARSLILILTAVIIPLIIFPLLSRKYSDYHKQFQEIIKKYWLPSLGSGIYPKTTILLGMIYCMELAAFMLKMALESQQSFIFISTFISAFVFIIFSMLLPYIFKRFFQKKGFSIVRCVDYPVDYVANIFSRVIGIDSKLVDDSQNYKIYLIEIPQQNIKIYIYNKNDICSQISISGVNPKNLLYISDIVRSVNKHFQNAEGNIY